MRPPPPLAPRRRPRPTFAKRRGLRLLALWLLLLVAACTGTSEDRTSLLLIVGIQQGGQSQLALLEDTQALHESVGERIGFVADSGRNLPAPAVSIDLTNRELQRDTAWVLTRSGTGTDVTAHLLAFNVAGIDPAAPTAFAGVGTPITLTTPGGGGIMDDEPTLNTVSCPNVVRSNRSGTRLLVLDEPRACAPNTTDSPVLWLVNTAPPSATLLVESADLLAAAPYTDQGFIEGGDSEERGYYLEDAIEFMNVFAFEFDDGPSGRYRNLSLRHRSTGLADMAGSFGALVALVDDALVGVDLEVSGEGESFGPVETVDDALRLELVRTPRSGITAVVLSEGRVEVHSGLSSDSPEADDVVFRGAAATIDGLESFGYVLGQGELLVLDLLFTPDSSEGLRSSRVGIGELALAVDPAAPSRPPLGVISWVRAAEPPPTP